jgi:outer membrane cobalamin receptor
MSIQVLKDMWFKSDVFMWSGPQIKTFPGNSAKLSGTVDLNAGLEFRVTKSLNLWLQTNNIFNNEYQRWNQYNVYGFNFVGGIVYSFAQKN